MIRYCKDCAAFVEVKYDDRRNEVCPACECFLFFTLRQRHFFLTFFNSKGATGYSATPRRGLFTHGGDSGTMVDAWEYGVNLDFFGPAPSIFAYEWDELEIEHLLPDDQPELELDRVVVPAFDQLQIGDGIMLRNGKTYRISRRIKTRDRSKKFALAGIDYLGSDAISATTLHKIKDWLPKSEMEARTEQMRVIGSFWGERIQEPEG